MNLGSGRRKSPPTHTHTHMTKFRGRNLGEVVIRRKKICAKGPGLSDIYPVYPFVALAAAASIRKAVLIFGGRCPSFPLCTLWSKKNGSQLMSGVSTSVIEIPDPISFPTEPIYIGKGDLGLFCRKKVWGKKEQSVGTRN